MPGGLRITREFSSIAAGVAGVRLEGLREGFWGPLNSFNVGAVIIRIGIGLWAISCYNYIVC